MSAVELVVARYAESLKWLARVPSSIAITVLDKNPDAQLPGATRLPNVGREAHSYLHFIVSHYDELSDVTVFCQGHPFDHAFDFHSTLRRIASAPDVCGRFLWLGHVIDTDDADGQTLFRSWSKNRDGRGLDLVGFIAPYLEPTRRLNIRSTSARSLPFRALPSERAPSNFGRGHCIYRKTFLMRRTVLSARGIAFSESRESAPRG